MGQYYIHANIDKKEAYNPDGIKLMEHSWVGNKSVEQLYQLLSKKWKGNRVVVAGDYFEAEENSTIGVTLRKSIYDVSWKSPKNIKDNGYNSEIGFYLNYDKKLAINLSKLPITEVYNGDEWKVSPLTLMIACGNGRGGGDYSGINEGYVGTWAGDHVGVELILPSDFVLIKPDFKE